MVPVTYRSFPSISSFRAASGLSVVCMKGVRGAAKPAPNATRLPAVVATLVRKKPRRDRLPVTSGSEAIGRTSPAISALRGDRIERCEQNHLRLKPAIGILLFLSEIETVGSSDKN